MVVAADREAADGGRDGGDGSAAREAGLAGLVLVAVAGAVLEVVAGREPRRVDRGVQRRAGHRARVGGEHAGPRRRERGRDERRVAAAGGAGGVHDHQAVVVGRHGVEAFDLQADLARAGVGGHAQGLGGRAVGRRGAVLEAVARGQVAAVERSAEQRAMRRARGGGRRARGRRQRRRGRDERVVAGALAGGGRDDEPVVVCASRGEAGDAGGHRRGAAAGGGVGRRGAVGRRRAVLEAVGGGQVVAVQRAGHGGAHAGDLARRAGARSRRDRSVGAEGDVVGAGGAGGVGRHHPQVVGRAGDEAGEPGGHGGVRRRAGQCDVRGRLAVGGAEAPLEVRRRGQPARAHLCAEDAGGAPVGGAVDRPDGRRRQRVGVEGRVAAAGGAGRVLGHDAPVVRRLRRQRRSAGRRRPGRRSASRSRRPRSTGRSRWSSRTRPARSSRGRSGRRGRAPSPRSGRCPRRRRRRRPGPAAAPC